jgi:hypothetical protein
MKVLYFLFFIVLFGGISVLLYWVYLPIKRQIEKTRKFSKKVSTRINWTFILLPCLISVFLSCYIDYRTSSKKRLEIISDIRLPNNFKVIKDEYQDMWQDWCIIYEIEFMDNSVNEVINRIKNSKFYSPNINQEDTLFVGKRNAIWSKTANGYYFRADKNRTFYSIDLDTVNNILKYIESSD